MVFKLFCLERMVLFNEEWIWREGEKVIWVVFRYVRGIFEERRYGFVFFCGFFRGFEFY